MVLASAEKIPGSGSWKDILLSALFMLILISLMNFVVNPFGLYPASIFPRIIISSYDKKLALFRELEPKPSALILGNSKVNSIDPQIVTEITGLSCFAWGLPDAKMEVSLASLRIAVEENDAPINLVIIGVDPEVFHPTVGIHPQARTSNGYTRYFGTQTNFIAPILNYARMFSFGQTRMSMVVLIYSILGKQVPDNFMVRPDGFIQFGFDINTISEEELEQHLRMIQEAIVTYVDTKWRPDEFIALSERRKQLWLDFLQICDEMDIMVYAMIPPVHPDLVKRLYDFGAGGIFDEDEDFIRSTMEGHDWVFRNLLDLESFDGDPLLFRDEVHMLPENGERLIRELLTDYDTEFVN